jgi:uncharacterized protein (DUF305 family)
MHPPLGFRADDGSQEGEGIMKLKYWLAMLTVAALPLATAAQEAPGGHQEQGAKQGSHAMPALNDEHFVAMMLKHHQDGTELAKVEESKGTREAVKTLAAKIRSSQERELSELKAHESKHADHSTPRGTSGQKPDASMQKHHEMMEAMAKESIAKVEKADGPAADQAFLQEMAKHHQMALDMIAKARLKDPELLKMSQKMAQEQKRELQELKKLQASK